MTGMAAAAFVKEEVDVIFGVALRCLSIHIHHSVFYSHQYQYFKKCSDTETAICPVLCVSPSKEISRWLR